MANTTVPLFYPPRLLPAPDAARYLGISETMLRELGIPRRMLRSRRLYDIHDLDAYINETRYDREREDDGAGDQAECDKLFGAGG